MKVFFCCLIVYTCVYATCRKRLDCTETLYSFQGNYSAYPDIDSIHVSDTIWLQLNMPVSLPDAISGTTIDYSGAQNLGTAIPYLQLDGGDVSHTGATPAANLFDNVIREGRETASANPQQAREFVFTEKAGSYRFNLGIVPKQKGLFAIGPGDAANVYTNKNKCDKASFRFSFKNTNQHLYLYEQSRPGYTVSEYERTHMYCFKVY